MHRTCSSRRGGFARLTALIATLAAVFGIALWFWSRPPARPNVDQGREVAEAFLGKLREGQPDQAWETTTAEFKSAQGKESFVRKVKPLKFLKEPLNFVSLQAVAIGPEQRSEYLFQSAKGETIRIVLGREAGAWKVDRWTPP